MPHAPQHTRAPQTRAPQRTGRVAILALAAALIAGVGVGPVVAAPMASDVAAPTVLVGEQVVTDASSARDVLPRGVSVDTRADTTTITYLVGLKRNSAALDEAAHRASDPTDLAYRDFLPLADAAKAYGANSKTLKKLRNAAKRAGLKVQVDPSRLFARLSGTAAQWNAVLGTKVEVAQPSPGDPYRTYFSLDGDSLPKPPKDFASSTSEWLTEYGLYVPEYDVAGVDDASVAELQDLLASPGSPTAWPRNTGTVPTGTCDAPALTSGKVYAPGQIQTAYGTQALAKKRMTGKGTRLAIISLGGGYDQADLTAAGDCFGFTVPPIDVALTTGMPTPFVSATIETHLDLITSAAVLPKAEKIHLVEAADRLVGFVESISRTLDLDGAPADVVSISYGDCEYSYLYGNGSKGNGPLLSLNEDVLRMAAVVGTTVVVASGDHGSSMCGDELADQATVWYPASSPWVTAVGGTRLTLKADNSRRFEVVWNDLPFTGSAPAPGPAGSGGASGLFERPGYQQGVTPIGPRMVPDVAMLADIRPGWPLVYGGEVFTVGGTSGASPFLAANLALMVAKERDRGYPRIGFANPWFYAAASGSKNPFYDVTSGSNAVELTGCCSAYAGFDMASGLGVPAVDALYATLPSPAG